MQLAVYHTKLFTGPWQPLEVSNLTLSGLNLNAVWQNIVAYVGDLRSPRVTRLPNKFALTTNGPESFVRLSRWNA